VKRRTTSKKAARPWSRTMSLRNAPRGALATEDAWTAGLVSRVRESLHPFQQDAFDDPSQLITMLVGRGGGKTTTAIARGLKACATRSRAKVIFIATTKNQAEELAWGPLKEAVARLGLTTDGANPDVIFNETKLRMTFTRTRSTYRLVGADDKKEIDKLRGQPFDEVQIDEGASYLPELLEWLLERIIMPRLGERDGVILLFGTPGHILRGQFYDNTRPGSPDHRPYSERAKKEHKGWDSWSSHTWTALAVTKLKHARKLYPAVCKNWEWNLRHKKRKGWSDDNPIWMREYLGLWAADDTSLIFRYKPRLESGELWNQWDPFEGVQIDRASVAGFKHALSMLPKFREWCHVVAMDEGGKDPFAFNVFTFAVDDPDRNVWHTFCVERKKMYAQPIAQLCLGDKLDHDRPTGLFSASGWPDGIIADAGNSLIDELTNVYGLATTQSDRSHKYKFAAIEVVNGDLVDGRLRILKDSMLEQQLQQLQWVTDEFGGVKENKAQANHCTDTLVIGRTLIGTLISAGGPGEDDEEAKKRRGRPQGDGVYSDPQGLDDDHEIPGAPRGEFDAWIAEGSSVEDEEAWGG
jgi:hypothetical protein